VQAAATPVEAILRHDRWVVATGLAGAAALAWAYQVYMAWGMGHGSAVIAALMPRMQGWTAWDLGLLFAMWALMMVAMMLPSVAPTVLAFAEINRRRREEQRPFVPTAVFLAGYLSAWVGFSLAATVVQAALHSAALLSPAMMARSPLFAGGILVATGVFQWTPLKQACLARCRSPLGFVLTHWRDGLAGAFHVGLQHGSYCVGCCALLMGLMLVNGVMNVWWMVLLSVFVLVEKLLPAHLWTARAVGALLSGWGLWMIVVR
jgi:predicted metal-binding membrane protein